MNNTKSHKIILAVTNDLVTDQRVNKIAKTLVSNNQEVILVGRLLPNSPELPKEDYKQIRMTLFFKTGTLFYAEYNIRLFLLLLFARFDVITANDLDTLPASYLISVLRRKKLVYDTHEYFTEVPELLENPFAKNVWTRLEQFIFPRLKTVSTVCQSIAEIYESKYKVPVAVIRNVPMMKLSTEKTKKDPEFENKRLIIYQGAVNVGRGIEMMIDTVRLLEDVVFLIIGGGDKLDELKQYVEEKQLTSKVKFTGKLHYSELYKYTLQADLGMSLEENLGLNYYYALPNKLFDYIQASTPVIASDLPEIKRIVADYNIGIIINERSPKALAHKINELFNNPELLNQLKENQAKAAIELCWENESKKVLQLYGL